MHVQTFDHLLWLSSNVKMKVVVFNLDIMQSQFFAMTLTHPDDCAIAAFHCVCNFFVVVGLVVKLKASGSAYASCYRYKRSQERAN